MSEPEQPQIYLVTPPDFDLGSFPDRLAAVLDAHDIACLRLSLATRDEDRILRAADACREVAHRFDVALVIDTHVVLAKRLGLDGVHLADGARSVGSGDRQMGHLLLLVLLERGRAAQGRRLELVRRARDGQGSLPRLRQ